MIKSKTILEVKMTDRTYEFSMAPDSPLGELFDALSQMRGLVIEKIKESQQVVKTDLPQEENQA